MSVPPPPLVNDVVVMNADKPGDIVQLVPGTIICSGTAASAVSLERPFTSSTRRYGREVAGSAPDFALDFRIDENGRAVDIHSAASPYPGYFIDTSDLGPSLAASRFPGGAAKSGCRISYSAKLTSVPTAPKSLLYETASAPTPGLALSHIYERLSEDGDCARGPGSPRRLNYPDFEAIAQSPGTRSWSFLRFDVDLAGRTRSVEIVGSSGNAALDLASVKALRANRYAPGKVFRRCTFNFYRLANAPITAPPMPPEAPKGTGDLPACAIDPKSMAMLLNGNAYPAPFAARRIEGYAIIGFDTAPWGAVGNVRVIAAEPDAAFGMAALQSIANAKVTESDVGHRGCIQRVSFRLPREKAAN